MTHLLQRLNADRVERLARDRQLRDDRLAVYSAFVGALVEFRRGQYDRAHRRFDGSDGEDYREARTESYRLRSAAQLELFRVQLVASDADITRCADEAMKLAEAIHDAQSVDEIQELGARAKLAANEFIDIAGATLRAINAK